MSNNIFASTTPLLFVQQLLGKLKVLKKDCGIISKIKSYDIVDFPELHVRLGTSRKVSNYGYPSLPRRKILRPPGVTPKEKSKHKTSENDCNYLHFERSGHAQELRIQIVLF